MRAACVPAADLPGAGGVASCLAGRGAGEVGPAARPAACESPVAKKARGPSPLTPGVWAFSALLREAGGVSTGVPKGLTFFPEGRAFCVRPAARSWQEGLVRRRSAPAAAGRSGRQEASGRCGLGGVRPVFLPEACAGSSLLPGLGARRATAARRLALSGSDRPRGGMRPGRPVAGPRGGRWPVAGATSRVGPDFGNARGLGRRGGVR